MSSLKTAGDAPHTCRAVLQAEPCKSLPRHRSSTANASSEEADTCSDSNQLDMARLNKRKDKGTSGDIDLLFECEIRDKVFGLPHGVCPATLTSDGRRRDDDRGDIFFEASRCRIGFPSLVRRI